MSKQKFERMWKVMKENNFEISNDVSSEFICTICKGLLIDACNAPCGCRYCRQCITEHLKGECKQCPGTSESCKDEEINIDCDIQVDQVINNRISKMKVKCPNVFCQTRVDIKLMENHLETCERQTNCPFTNIGCGEDKLTDEKMNEHLLSEIHSHINLLMEWVNISRNETELLKKGMEQLRSENDELVNKKEQSERETISNMKAFKDEMCELQNQNKHLKETVEDLQNQFGERVTNLELKTQEVQKTQLIDQFDRQCQTIRTQFDEKLKYLEMKMNETSRAWATHEISLNNQIDHIRLCFNASMEFVWQIQNWSDMQMQAQRDNGCRVYSEPFCSYNNGYRMRLVLYPCGIVDETGAYLSIYFVIMKGPNDDFLAWPFKNDVEFSLMNQQTGLSHATGVLKYTDEYPDCQAFNKPKNVENDIQFGLDQFIELAQLSTISGLIKHNQLVIKCLVHHAEK